MRYLTFTSLALVLATLCPTAISQAVTEYGLGAGRAATTTAPAGKIANGISGVFDSLSKAAGADSGAAASGSSSPSLERRRTAAHPSRGRTQAKQPAKPVTEAVAAGSAAATTAYENPEQIKAGIDYDELVRRFGPPSMSVASGPGTSTLWYSGADGSYQVEVENGKVIAPKRTSSQ